MNEFWLLVQVSIATLLCTRGYPNSDSRVSADQLPRLYQNNLVKEKHEHMVLIPRSKQEEVPRFQIVILILTGFMHSHFDEYRQYTLSSVIPKQIIARSQELAH